ncbi:MAG: ABC transporter ATP-binding protein [Rhizobiales bacterium]|nr:ABC transporter ATP-binding protein [Hyphomicrobiales bacterium]NRB15742.1 ABC transporter ATP-binding protein [Hyphomicrobiales bacterium]
MSDSLKIKSDPSDEIAQTPLLEVRGLSVVFDTPDGPQEVVDQVDLKVCAGRTLGLVGESGSGKSVTCLGVMRLLDTGGRVTSGEVMFEGRDLLKNTEEEMEALRGCKIGMVFQDPMVSLNPVRTIGWQISESLRLHRNLSKAAAKHRTMELLDLVGIPEPKTRYAEYPHQFSGGMSQRAMIAMAIACQPKLLIADEPTTALDVTIQAQILELLSDLKKELDMALILITHDLGVIAEAADDVAVMYAGRVVEEASVLDLFDNPLHHYTLGLLNSLPRIDRSVDRLNAIEGTAPPPQDFVEGCRFESRCGHCSDHCYGVRPSFNQVSATRRVACMHPREMT